ncbi:type II toxin-antitoxin system RelE/ParE family toxin [bacterium]|nr:type II toxin-antitoxin system RelE/ParE family toxin [Candidatus Paceibacterota bacterium]MCK6544191.1 type II toxin-antitoxin system RelE/ParE family toxin [bacterium]
MPSKYEIHLLRIAEQDFYEIIDFISSDSQSSAEKVADSIENNLSHLTAHHQLGRVPKEPELAGAGFRYLVVENYLIFYTIEEQTIFVHRIIHGARDYRRLL